MRFLSRFHSAALERTNCRAQGGVFQRRLHRRLDLLFDAVLDVAVVDRHDGDALVEERLGIGLLVAVLPAAAVNVEDDRCRLVGLGRIEVQYLTCMVTVGHVEEPLGLVGPLASPAKSKVAKVSTYFIAKTPWGKGAVAMLYSLRHHLPGGTRPYPKKHLA